jgi:hypothetical protein
MLMSPYMYVNSVTADIRQYLVGEGTISGLHREVDGRHAAGGTVVEALRYKRNVAGSIPDGVI